MPTVLQVIPELDTGGAERTTIDVAAAVVAAGGRCLVASEGGRMVEELEAAGARHVSLPMSTKSPFGMAMNAQRLVSLIRREVIDVVHARSRAPAWSSLWAARRTGIAFVTTYHGAYNQKTAWKQFYNSVMARGDVSIANSRYIAGLMRERHGIQDSRLEVIHRGSDVEAFRPGALSQARLAALRFAWALPDDAEVILNVARLTAWKGQKVILQSLRELARRENRVFGPGKKPLMIFAGDHQGREGYLRDLRNMAVKYGLEERVRFVGHVEDVPAAHALARVAVVASVEPEAFGRAAVEAQAAGIPVVVSDHGAAAETVLAPPDVPETGRTGWRVPAGNPGALADAIARALAMPDDARDQLGQRARDHVREHFSVATMTDKTLDVYRRLAPGPLA